jgi:hypothetical protein
VAQEKKQQTDAEVLIEGLKDLLGPANNLLEGFVEHTGSTSAMTSAFQQSSATALFTGRFEEWKVSFDAYRQAYNKNLEDSKNLLRALDLVLEKGPTLEQEYRDSLVSFRVTISNLAENEPIKEINYEEEESGGCGEPLGCTDCKCKR